MTTRTYSPKPSQIERKWHLVDATDQILGRLATRLATVLMGKHKPMYAPHLDCGDHIVVVNVERIRVTGKKADQKSYWVYSGYPSGHHGTSFREMLAKHPDRILRLAVRGMLPKTQLGRHMLLKLKIYAGPEHPHAAQDPQPLDLKKKK
ncbi:MAG: 50S ribosomal protein L13 [Planctomycetes bacterium]|nr:50S ribosomal protein L13 [Planctomycetota bacterium]